MSPYVSWIYVSVEIVHSCLEQFHNKIGDTGHTCVMAEYMLSTYLLRFSQWHLYYRYLKKLIGL